ncbi:hypothetical protein GW796_08855 [archaeon]|nr:hypothetical protein [archaeon]NCQ51987.1 hypothetical protein [archaeon]
MNSLFRSALFFSFGLITSDIVIYSMGNYDSTFFAGTLKTVFCILVFALINYKLVNKTNIETLKNLQSSLKTIEDKLNFFKKT